MSRLKQSFSWWSFAQGVEPIDLVKAAKGIGYAGVDLARPEHWDLIRDNGLALAAVSAHSPLTVGFNRRENHDRLVDETAAKLEQAKQYDIPTLVVFSGNREGISDDEGAANTAEGLRRVAPLAEAAGVTLVIELLNSRHNHPDYQADKTAWGVKVCEAVGSPNVRLLYDIYHMQIEEGDVIDRINTCHQWFGHYHTAGVPGRRDLDDEQELNYPAIIRAIRATGYNGYVAHEFKPKADPLAALDAAFRVCDV